MWNVLKVYEQCLKLGFDVFFDDALREELLDVIKDESIVVIDEAQFFDANIVTVIKALLDDARNVVVAGLDLDFRGEPFGAMPDVLSLADTVT